MIKAFKKQRFYQKLDVHPVYLIDNTTTSDNYFAVSDLPKKLVAGKNSFKIKANNKHLKIGSNVLFEVIDQNKNVIYSETHEYLDRNGKKIITIYIYPDTSISTAQITLLGVATKNVLTSINKLNIKSNTEIPNEWRDRYNIKWSYKLSIDPLEKNNNEIILNKAPNITAIEIFKQQNYFDYTHNSNIEHRSNAITTYTSSEGYSASYKTPLNLKSRASNYPAIQNNFTKFGNGINTTYDTNSNGLTNSDAIQYTTPFNTQTNTAGGVIQSNAGFYYEDVSYSTITLYSQSAPTPGYEFSFKKSMVGGTINIFTPNNPTPQYSNFLSSDDECFSAVIVNVLNEGQIQVSTPYIRQVLDSNNKIQDVIYKQFENSQFHVTYSSDYSNSNSEARKNFAEITITDLDLISGDVYRIKPFVKSITDASDYIPQTDIIINSKNILISTSSVQYYEPLGDFISQNFINTYWDIDNLSDASTATIEYNSNVFLNGLHIYTNTPITAGYLGISQALNATHCNLYSDNYYEITLNVHGEKQLNNDNQVFEIIGHGTAFDSDYPFSEPIGSLIGKIQIPSTANEITYKNLTFGFTPNRTGIADIAFVIHGGEWTISDVQIKSVKLPGFTPTQLKFLVPLQPIWDNDTLNFKFELYNSNGVMANQVLLLNNVQFNHGYSHFIQGQYNLITGSAWLGKSLNTGIELTGKHSGIVKSVGYDGWNAANAQTGAPGFLLWSGSFVLSSSLNTDPTSYSGVGIELHGGHTGSEAHALHFDTVTGQLQVTGSIIATDAVFNNYAISDYMGSRVLIINSSNKTDYIKSYVTNSVSWSYLDLSSEVTDSAMFVRFEDVPQYPITHIQIPTMYSFTDNEVGGTVTLEFAPTLPTIYFKELPIMSGNTYLPVSPLSKSNAIRNYSGSFTYLGFNEQSGSDYINLLPSRAGARYLFTKGFDGFGLTSCTNYDEILMTYKDVALLNQYGTRRNQFIQPKEINLGQLITGSFTESTSSWYGFNYYIASSSISDPFTSTAFQVIKSLNFKFIVPEFIINHTGSLFHYFTCNATGSSPRAIKIFSQSYSTFNHDLLSISNAIDNYTSSIIILPDIGNMLPSTSSIVLTECTLDKCNSGDIIDYNFSIGYVGYEYINYLGSRLSFDYKSNFGGFNNTYIKPMPIK